MRRDLRAPRAGLRIFRATGCLQKRGGSRLRMRRREQGNPAGHPISPACVDGARRASGPASFFRQCKSRPGFRPDGHITDTA